MHFEVLFLLAYQCFIFVVMLLWSLANKNSLQNVFAFRVIALVTEFRETSCNYKLLENNN